MIQAIRSIIEQNQKLGMTVAEIGCFIGETTVNYAPVIKENEGTIMIVEWFRGSQSDTYEDVPYPMYPHSYRPELEDDRYNDFLGIMKDYLDICKIYKGDSHSMASHIEDGSLDICFIDADHRYANVKKDIELYLPKVKKGGILCGHDCNDISRANTFTPEQLLLDTIDGHLHAGVVQAVYDHFGTEVEIVQDPGGENIPLWLKRIV